jgi:hypothetical protein
VGPALPPAHLKKGQHTGKTVQRIQELFILLNPQTHQHLPGRATENTTINSDLPQQKSKVPTLKNIPESSL